MKFNWVTLRVGDLENSLFFYTKLLKLEIAAQFGSPEHQIVMLGKADGAKIELICEPGKKIDQPGNGVSIGLELDNLDGLVGALRESNLPVSGPVSPNPNVRFFFVQDPDGYTIQLVEQKA